MCGFGASRKIYTNQGWALILKEIIYYCKPYIDAELDVALERFLYVRRRPKGQSFAQYITHLKKLRDDVCDILGQEKFECSKCGHVDHKKHKIPEYIWRYLIIKTCDTSKEEKRLMLHWHHDLCRQQEACGIVTEARRYSRHRRSISCSRSRV